MSTWPGKFVIGLTGNIATGKSVVRRMLEHLGAYGIDADALSHRAMAQDAPGYQPVVNAFGRWILADDGQIERSKLARIVFADPQALKELESIIHPLVRQAVDVLVRRAPQRVIVLEAIKLIESPLRQGCDSLWVTFSPQETQLKRLMQKRGMSQTAAALRLNAQPPQEEKIGQADVVIRNDGNFDDTWKQVLKNWQALFPAVEVKPPQPASVPSGQFQVERASPRHAADIAYFINKTSAERVNLEHEDIMAAFGEKAFLLLRREGKLQGLVGWQVENLVARTGDIHLDPAVPLADGLRVLMEEVERASRELQCEISLVFLNTQLGQQSEVWNSLGYQECTIQSLGVRAWQEAAIESMPPGSGMRFKQLRKDRVLRPV